MLAYTTYENLTIDIISHSLQRYYFMLFCEEVTLRGLEAPSHLTDINHDSIWIYYIIDLLGFFVVHRH